MGVTAALRCCESWSLLQMTPVSRPAGCSGHSPRAIRRPPRHPRRIHRWPPLQLRTFTADETGCSMRVVAPSLRSSPRPRHSAAACERGASGGSPARAPSRGTSRCRAAGQPSRSCPCMMPAVHVEGLHHVCRSKRHAANRVAASGSTSPRTCWPCSCSRCAWRGRRQMRRTTEQPPCHRSRACGRSSRLRANRSRRRVNSSVLAKKVVRARAAPVAVRHQAQQGCEAEHLCSMGPGGVTMCSQDARACARGSS